MLYFLALAAFPGFAIKQVRVPWHHLKLPPAPSLHLTFTPSSQFQAWRRHSPLPLGCPGCLANPLHLPAAPPQLSDSRVSSPAPCISACPLRQINRHLHPLLCDPGPLLTFGGTGVGCIAPFQLSKPDKAWSCLVLSMVQATNVFQIKAAARKMVAFDNAKQGRKAQ